MSYGVPALHGNGGQSVDRQLTTKHRQEPCDATPHSRLPLDSVLTVVPTGPEVHSGDHEEIHANAEVGEGQVAHQEPRHGQLAAARKYHKQHGQVARNGQDIDEPNGHPQEAKTGDVLAGVKSVRLWTALEGRSALTQV